MPTLGLFVRLTASSEVSRSSALVALIPLFVGVFDDAKVQ